MPEHPGAFHATDETDEADEPVKLCLHWAESLKDHLAWVASSLRAAAGIDDLGTVRCREEVLNKLETDRRLFAAVLDDYHSRVRPGLPPRVRPHARRAEAAIGEMGSVLGAVRAALGLGGLTPAEALRADLDPARLDRPALARAARAFHAAAPILDDALAGWAEALRAALRTMADGRLRPPEGGGGVAPPHRTDDLTPFQRGPKAKKARVERRHQVIDRAKEAGFDTAEAIFKHLQEIDPDLVRKGKKGWIDPDYMMDTYRRAKPGGV
jgi:hypothetical protein